MLRKFFKAIKIKMDNYHLRYELIGADEEISILKNKLKKTQQELDELKKQLAELQGEGK